MPTTLLETVAQYCEQHHLLPQGSSGIVAFSGGPDSLGLLHILKRIAPIKGLRLTAVHVDHGLRQDSMADAQAAQRLAESVGVPCIIVRVAIEAEGNRQERARHARKEALEREAKRQGAQWIALGHTATDQAETVLMRVVRGSGLRGLAAMRPLDPDLWVSSSAQHGNRHSCIRHSCIRPLLATARDAIEAYVRGQGLSPILDPSNEQPIYLRNRIRKTLMPAMAQENPQIVQALCRLAQHASAENEALQTTAARLEQQMVTESTGSVTVDLTRLRSHHPELIKRVLLLVYWRSNNLKDGKSAADRHPLSQMHQQHLVDLAMRNAGSEQLKLPRCWAYRSYNRLELLKERPIPSFSEIRVEQYGTLRWKQWDLVLERKRAWGNGNEIRDSFDFPLTIRSPLPGDRICIGIDQSRKVSRVLMDAKIPAPERANVPLLVANDGQGSSDCSAGRVLLVGGVRAAFDLRARKGEWALNLSPKSTPGFDWLGQSFDNVGNCRY